MKSKLLWGILAGIAVIAVIALFKPASAPTPTQPPLPGVWSSEPQTEDRKAATKTDDELRKLAWMLAYGAHCTRPGSEDHRQLIQVGIWANLRYGEDRVEAETRRVSADVTKTRGHRDAFCSTMRSDVDLFLSQLPL